MIATAFLMAAIAMNAAAMSTAESIAAYEGTAEAARDPAEKEVEAPKDMKLVLLIGQSNMSGRAPVTGELRKPIERCYKLNRDNKWVAATNPFHFDRKYCGVGPADEFARRYLADHPGETLGLVPCAVGGSPLSAWVPAEDGKKGAYFRRAMERAKAAQANGEFVAILWHQGETDAAKASAESLMDYYPKGFSDMIAAFRSRLGIGESVPVVVGEIGRWMRKDGDHAAKVNPAIRECAKRVANCACVSSEGLKNLDQHHFDGPSVKILGDRYYEEWRALWDAPRVAKRLSELFLATSPDLYSPAGYKAPKAYGGGQLVHYSVVSLWVNALECARLAGDADLERRLVAAFDPAYGEKKIWMNDYRHVDLSIIGAVPLEIAILTGDARAKKLGLMYADRQWEEPKDGMDWGDRWYDAIPLAERHANWEKGFSPETRLWIDDMYMITFLQSQAYRLTGDKKYIERAGKEMCMYLGKLQRPDGLFNHAPGAPFAWGRGNGWMAAAMAMNLAALPEDSEWRVPILAGAIKMMEALKKWQRPNGLWGQLVDDPESYDETSATAMFAYAFAEGEKAGALGSEYRAAAVRAFNALVSRLDEYGNLPDVCVGTGWKNDRRHYLTRPRANGDPHGQAPLLWLCRALME